MRIELKRGIRNGYYVLMILVNMLSVLLGYILLVTIDEMEKVTFWDLWESVYTVYTQFGTLLFSSIIIMQFYNDYKEKNIIFYKSLNKNAVSYFMSKLLVIILGTMAGTLISSLMICVPYGEIEWLLVVFLKMESVMIYYCLIMSVIGFLFENFLVGFFSNFLIWIIGIVISDVSIYLEFFAYYDASGNDYARFDDFLTGNLQSFDYMFSIGENYLYDIIVAAICVIIVVLFKRRWIKNGI